MMRREVRRVRMEMVPLMDCMFLLLTFFIYYAASASATTHLPIELPSAQSGIRQTDEASVLRLVIAADGTLTVGGQPVALEQLVRRLTEWRVAHPDARVHIAADQAVAYRVPLMVLDAARSAGITKIELEANARVR